MKYYQLIAKKSKSNAVYVASPTDQWTSQTRKYECDGCLRWDYSMIVPPVNVELKATSLWHVPPSIRVTRDKIGVVIVSWEAQINMFRADFAKRAFRDSGFYFGEVIVDNVPWSEYVSVFADNYWRVASTYDKMISSDVCSVCGRPIGVSEADARTILKIEHLGGRPIVISDDRGERVFISEKRWSEISSDFRHAFKLDQVILE